MAIYHFSVSSVSRQVGRSAVRSAAYITGTRRVDERTGRVCNYDRKAREVLATDTFGPIDWQAVERAERRKDAKVARSIIVALPHELPPWAHRSLVADFATLLRRRHGMAGEWAIHVAPGDERNVHAHILTTTRHVDDDGNLSYKLRSLDQPRTSGAILKRWRQEWEDLCNRSLDQHNVDAHLDCRSLAARGILRPARQHLGPENARRHLLGYPTEAGSHNAKVDAIERANAELARTRSSLHHFLATQRRERVKRQTRNARWRRRRILAPNNATASGLETYSPSTSTKVLSPLPVSSRDGTKRRR